MNDLNFNSKKKEIFLIHFVYQKNAVSFDRVYTYPEQDICLFRHFPHERYVLPVIVPGRFLACTCTLKWLQLNVKQIKQENAADLYNSNDFYEPNKNELQTNYFQFYP
jgi:hypothetical protein